MSWIAKEVMKKLGLEEKELETLRRLEDISEVLKVKVRILEKIKEHREEIESKEFAEMFGVDKLSPFYFEDEESICKVNICTIKTLDLPRFLLIAPILSELEGKGYSIKIYGLKNTIPTVSIIPREGEPIAASIIGFCFPIYYAFHPEYSKIIDKIAKEVYGLSPPKNYEK